MTIFLLCLFIYLFGFVPVWRRMAGKLLHANPKKYDRYGYARGGLNKDEALGVGFLLTLIWPLTLGYLIFPGNEFVIPPKEVRQAQKLEDQKRRIADLERQLLGVK